ncbi:HDOD domain-containing protein [Ectothiorhodospiraceae bacterium WFHF3C12]|nr:HDOD domain-containing protein [Ectothiorhodospiraceae bacterium WFHF3C12]
MGYLELMALPSARDLVLSTKDLPSPPAVYLSLSRLMGSEHWNAREAAQLIGADPALASRLLRVANSPLFAGPRRIASIDQAVVLLGENEIRSLVLATTVLDRFRDVPDDLASADALRRRALYCGLATAELGTRSAAGLPPDQLFLTGLVFDIGSLVACLRLPEAVREALLAGRVPASGAGPSIECAVTGSRLALIGAELLAHWRLPESVVEPVRFSGVPWEANVQRAGAALVHIASRLSATLVRGADGEAVDLVPDETVTVQAGLADLSMGSVVERVQAGYESLAALIDGTG